MNNIIYTYLSIIILPSLLSNIKYEFHIIILIYPFFIFYYLNNIALKIRAIIISFFLITSLCFIIISNIYIDKNSSALYKLTGIIYPLYELVKNSNVNTDSADLAEIDKILKIDVLLSSQHGMRAFWDHFVGKITFGHDEFMRLVPPFLSLLQKHPKVFAAERCRVLLGAQPEDFTKASDSASLNKLLSELPDSFQDRNTVKMLTSHPAADQRQRLIAALHRFNAKYPANGIHLAVIPSLCLLALSLVLLLRRRMADALLPLFPLPPMLIVFLSAPGSYGMYYFPLWLCGLVLPLAALIVWLGRQKKRRTAG
jgi:hypothetical protein